MGDLDLTPAQLKSIEVLLRKSLPDLSAVEHTGDSKETTWLVKVPSPEKSEDWENIAQDWSDAKKDADKTKH
jgi:hypothetical protein